ncbi:ATP-binding protein [Streptomyces sp. NPDC048606]|uniref:ATP-binding protein n=1 Tax=Streptomyces sp. NPDC048606 TaxID=3154726 RepID=UPI0034197E72
MDATLDATPTIPAPARRTPSTPPRTEAPPGPTAAPPGTTPLPGAVTPTARPKAEGEAGAETGPRIGAAPTASPTASPTAPAGGPLRPAVTELRLAAFGPHRAARFALGPVTLFTGSSGSGKSQALEAYGALAALGCGRTLDEVFPDPSARVPERARPDADGRRGFRIGCTVDGPVGPVSLDLAVQAEPTLRIAGERLTQDGRTLFSTAQRDPRRRSVEAAWLTGGAVGVTRAPLPDDRLGTALLPLRVAGATADQRHVLAAVEQVVVALRSVFPCAPNPARMRTPVPTGEGRLRGDCANLADVLRRTRDECATRHALLVTAARTACAGPVADLVARGPGGPGGGLVTARLDRGPDRPATALGRLGAGELRFLALALVLLTGPGVLAVDPAAELLSARQALTVLADGLDRDLDRSQRAELLRLALLSCARGHVRLVATTGAEGAATAQGLPGVSVVDLSP